MKIGEKSTNISEIAIKYHQKGGIISNVI